MDLYGFDGSTFKQYNQSNDRSIMSTRLVSLHVGENDTVFVRTTDKQFYRVNHFGRLQLFTPSSKYAVEIKERSGGIPFIIYEQCRRKIDNKEQPPWIMPGLRYVTASNGKSMALYAGHYYWFNEKNELIVADTAFLHFKN